MEEIVELDKLFLIISEYQDEDSVEVGIDANTLVSFLKNIFENAASRENLASSIKYLEIGNQIITDINYFSSKIRTWLHENLGDFENNDIRENFEPFYLENLNLNLLFFFGKDFMNERIFKDIVFKKYENYFSDFERINDKPENERVNFII